jgi:hypothetical protein
MDDDTIVARYIHDLCSDMRRYAESDLCKAYRALEHRVRSTQDQQDQLELERLYVALTNLADGGDHQMLYERVLQAARKHGYTLTPGPKPRQLALIDTAHPDEEPFMLAADSPLDVQAADIMHGLASTEMAHRPISYGPYRPQAVRTIVAEAVTYCVLRALGADYPACVPALVLAEVPPDVVEEWSGVVADLYARLMQDRQA